MYPIQRYWVRQVEHHHGTYVLAISRTQCRLWAGPLASLLAERFTLRHRGQADAHRDRGRHSDASRVAGRYRATAQRPRTASSVSMRIVSRTERCAARCRPSHGTNPSEDWRREAGRQLRDQLDVPARRTPNRDLLIQLPAEPPSRGHLTKRSRSTNGTSVRVVVLVRQAGSSR